jgi:hypothetical protein
MKPNSPKVVVNQWQALYKRGAARAPPVGLLASACLGFAAYQHYIYSSTEASKLFVVAALSSISIVPFTLSAMRSTNGRLIQLAGTEEKAAAMIKSEEVSELLGKWQTLNAIRAALPLLAAAIGWYATTL